MSWFEANDKHKFSVITHEPNSGRRVLFSSRLFYGVAFQLSTGWLGTAKIFSLRTRFCAGSLCVGDMYSIHMENDGATDGE